ncbi:hypothetical protein EWM64_g8809, partial [Hericium alpestre]
RERTACVFGALRIGAVAEREDRLAGFGGADKGLKLHLELSRPPVQSTLFSDVPQAHVPIDTYASTYPPADQCANFSSGPLDTDLGSLGLEWNGNLLNESTASPYQTTSYDGAYLSTPGPSSFNKLATYALPDATEPEPAYYAPNYSAATSTIDDVDDGAYLSTPGPSSFNKLATYVLPDATEPEPAYYPPIYPPATSSIGDVEYGFNTYLPVSLLASPFSFDAYLSFILQESANPSFLSNRSAWVGPAPEELSQPEERLIPVETACPEDCFDVTGLPLTPPAPLYDSPLQTLYNTSPSTASYNFLPSTASYDTSPSTASFDGSLFKHEICPATKSAHLQHLAFNSVLRYVSVDGFLRRQALPGPVFARANVRGLLLAYLAIECEACHAANFIEHHFGPYSPAATSVDSWSAPSSAKPVLPPSGTSLCRPAPYAITVASSWPVASSSKRRCDDDDVLEMPRTKRIKEVGEYQGLLLPPPVAGSSKRRLEDDEESVDEPRMKRIKEIGEYQGLLLPLPVAGSSKRRLEDDEESVDEPLMKKMRKMKNKKRPARSAETRARRVSSEAFAATRH